MSDLGVVEETMTEVRRNWNVMLQDQVALPLRGASGPNSSHH